MRAGGEAVGAVSQVAARRYACGHTTLLALEGTTEECPGKCPKCAETGSFARCKHCPCRRGEHSAQGAFCPLGRRGRAGTHWQYSASQRFEPRGGGE